MSKLIRRSTLGLLAMALSASEARAMRRPDVHVVGSCRVRTSAASTPPSAGARGFVVEVGKVRVLIAPTTEQWLPDPSSDDRLDAVLLTSLSEESLTGVVRLDQVGFSGVKILVDRTVFDLAASVDKRYHDVRFGALVASRRLYAHEANVDLLPGIRFTVPPSAIHTGSRLRVRCGESTLFVMSGHELALSGFASDQAAALERHDPARLAGYADDRSVLAITDGPYPALASIYHHEDGFRLGPIEAREFGGATRRRPQVIVEPTGSDAHP